MSDYFGEDLLKDDDEDKQLEDVRYYYKELSWRLSSVRLPF